MNTRRLHNRDMSTTLKRYTVEESGVSLRLMLPYRTQWFTTTMLALGFVFLVAAFIPLAFNLFMGNMVWFLGNTHQPIFFLNIAILLLTALLWLVEILWQLVGKEVVEVTDDHIIIQHQIFGLRIRNKYHADSINGVFISRQKEHWLTMLFSSRGFRFLNFGRGRVALNSGKTIFGEVKTYRFGSILDEEEAQQIVTMIHRRFPKYKYKSKGVG